MGISANIRERREAAGLTRQQLADLIDVSRAAVGHWETGHAMPRMGHIEQMANAFGCSITDLIQPVLSEPDEPMLERITDIYFSLDGKWREYLLQQAQFALNQNRLERS